MAKSSSPWGTIIGLGIAGVGVWYLGDIFGWWSGIGTAAATTTTATTTTATATVQLASAVTPTLNNALQATFVINGASEQIAVIPNGDAYNNSGEDITATLAAEGVTPAQLYALMAAAYTPVATAPVNTTLSPGNATTYPVSTTAAPSTGRGTTRTLLPHPLPVKATGRGGLGQVLSGATRRNYVRRGTAF